MTVSAVIPHWNRRELLLELLKDLRNQQLPPQETLVVDNGSTDGSPEAAEGCGARVIRLPRNMGFAHAVNRGIRESSSEWIAILNNDVRLSDGYLSHLATAAQKTGAWFAAGKLLNARDHTLLDGCYDLLSISACSWRAGNGRKDAALWNESRPIALVPFTAALFRRELFQRVGPLDETFESYLEDVEFGIRCALTDCDGVYVPEAVAYHEGSATLGAWNPETVRRIARNQLLIVARHYPPDWISRYGWKVLIGQLLWGIVAARHGAALAFLKGKREGIAKLRQTARKEQPGIDTLLRQSERDLQHLQQATGYDRFWRCYFALT